MAMMICVALDGGGGGDVIVSVLCGAGGGLTVQPEISVINAEIATMTRTGLGTLFRVSAASERLRTAGFRRRRGLNYCRAPWREPWRVPATRRPVRPCEPAPSRA